MIVNISVFLPFLQTESLKCVAQASKNRSLADFEKVGCSSSVPRLLPFESSTVREHTDTDALHSEPAARPIVIIATNRVLSVI